jgi:hypothetical protein
VDAVGATNAWAVGYASFPNGSAGSSKALIQHLRC